MKRTSRAPSSASSPGSGGSGGSSGSGGSGTATSDHELRSALGNLRAAAEALAMALDGQLSGERAQLLRIVTEEAARASRAVEEQEARATTGSARRRGLRLSSLAHDLERRVSVAADLRLRLDGSLAGSVAADPDLLVALTATLARLRKDFAIGEVTLSATQDGGMIALDFRWPSNEPETERLREAHAGVLGETSAAHPSVRSLRDATRAVGGEVWMALRRGGDTASLRVLLPRTDRPRAAR